MENGQKETQVEKVAEEKPTEVKPEKPAAEEKPKTEETKAESKSDEKKEETETPETPAEVPEPTPELLEKIRKQVEFYFGDINMQRDKFLIEQTQLDAGWIPMHIMLNFKMLTAMSKSTDVILKALENSELIEISEDKRKIRRSPEHPLPVYDEEYRKAQESRTVYLRGFPLQDINIEKLKEFFKQYEPIENIIMRKYMDKEKKLKFKGSIFAQFKTLDDAKAFMARDPIKYEEVELIRKWSLDYTEEKSKEKEERRQKRSDHKGKKNEDGKEGGEADGEDDASEKDSGLPKGSVIYFEDVVNTCTREDIKECLLELEAPIVFIDFRKGETRGWVRLQGENAAKPILDKMKDNKITVCEKEVTCRVLEGEEEAKYLAKVKEDIANTRQKTSRSKRGGRRSRGGHRGRKRPFHFSSKNEVPTKKVATE